VTAARGAGAGFGSAGPKIMLMDEPFFGVLINRLRGDIRDETLGILKEEGPPYCLVTHETRRSQRHGRRKSLDARRLEPCNRGPPITVYYAPCRIPLPRSRFFLGRHVLRAKYGAWRIRSFGPVPGPRAYQMNAGGYRVSAPALRSNFDRGGKGLCTATDGDSGPRCGRRARSWAMESLVDFV